MATKNNLPELTSEQVKPTIFIENAEQEKQYTDLLKELVIDPAHPEPEPETLLSLNDTPILWRGGKSFVCAVAKARKTTTLTMFTAILCGRDESANGFRAVGNCRVLYIDTEQSRTDSQRILFRVARLCNKEPQEITNALQVLSLNKQAPDEIRCIMEAAVKAYHPDVIILDNWTDCITSVMDDADCTTFSRQLRMLAEVYGIAIFSVIHANENARNDVKPNFRGWGAEEARKSDLTLFLKDMGDYSEATFGRCRGKRPDGFNVSIDNDGLPYFYKAEAPTTPQVNPDKYAAIVAEIPKFGASFTELKKIVLDKASNVKSDYTARDWVLRMEKSGAVVKVDGRYYRPADKPNQSEPEELPF
ncbi:MAG: AAA family ATPase [Lachnospiraceae bacterium]|nr:AAA family ATPase [Lachnospiraceae bacterium]